MFTESTREMTLSKDEVSAAIEAIRSKGWDINPYTVADEINTPRAVIYRNVEFMRLIIDARGGTFGLDVETSLNLAHRIQDLEATKAELQEHIGQLKEQLAANAKVTETAERLTPTEGDKAGFKLEQVISAQTAPEAEVVEKIGTGTIADSEPTVAIYNAAAIGNYPGLGAVTLSSIHWKELEKLMNLQLDTLDNLSMSAATSEQKTQPSQWDIQPESEDEHAKDAKTRKRNRKRSHEITGDFEVSESDTSLSLPMQDQMPIQFQIEESQRDEAERTDEHAAVSGQEALISPPTQGPIYLDRDLPPDLSIRTNGERQEHPFGTPSFQEDDPIDQIGLDEISPRHDEGPSIVPAVAATPEVEEISDTSWMEEEELALHEEAIALTAERHEQIVGSASSDRYDRHEAPPVNEAPEAAPLVEELAFDSSSYDVVLDPEPESFIEIESAPESNFVLATSIPPVQPAQNDFTSHVGKDRTVITDDYPKVDANLVFDLDNADIFEDIDGDTIVNIEVIEDVVPPEERLLLPPQSNIPVIDLTDALHPTDVLGESLEPLTAPDAGEGEEGDTVSGEELRQLIKNRIEQAEQHTHGEALGAKETAKDKEKELPKGSPRSKFVGTKAGDPPQPTSAFVTRVIPPEIRKACLILGVRPEELTITAVTTSWKQQIASPGVHPDLGGDTESAIYLNTAKDTLVRWLDQQAPKLGKKFGRPSEDSSKT